MQHNVTETVLASFSRLRAGMRYRTSLGFDVLELVDESADRLTPRRHDLRAQQLLWSETDPPHPNRLQVSNRGQAGLVIDVGTVLDGGMAMRAMRASIVIPGQTEMNVPVEPLAGRWWDEGPLRWRGRLEPAAAALLLQSVLGSQPLASSARTALWSMPPSELLATAAPFSTGSLCGWHSSPVTQARGDLSLLPVQASTVPETTRPGASSARSRH